MDSILLDAEFRDTVFPEALWKGSVGTRGLWFYTCRYRKVWDLLYSDPDKEQCT